MAVVFECVPYQVGELATRNLGIPTIGIGAGADTDGQVLVYHDVIRYGVNRVAKFVKVYGDANELIGQSINRYVNEVKSKDFPSKEHSFTMKEEQLTELYGGKR